MIKWTVVFIILHKVESGDLNIYADDVVFPLGLAKMSNITTCSYDLDEIRKLKAEYPKELNGTFDGNITYTCSLKEHCCGGINCCSNKDYSLIIFSLLVVTICVLIACCAAKGRRSQCFRRRYYTGMKWLYRNRSNDDIDNRRY